MVGDTELSTAIFDSSNNIWIVLWYNRSELFLEIKGSYTQVQLKVTATSHD